MELQTTGIRYIKVNGHRHGVTLDRIGYRGVKALAGAHSTEPTITYHHQQTRAGGRLRPGGHVLLEDDHMIFNVANTGNA